MYGYVATMLEKTTSMMTNKATTATMVGETNTKIIMKRKREAKVRYWIYNDDLSMSGNDIYCDNGLKGTIPS